MAVTATIRMYRLDELGDCFLLSFTDGEARSHVLIDCGSFRNGAASKARLRVVAEAIRADLDGAPLDVVVGTHQHNDHLNGFLHCEDVFTSIGVERVWLSWLDSPSDAEAVRIGRDFHNLRRQLAAARDALSERAPARRAHAVVGVMNDVLGFFGASEVKTPPETPARATEVLRRLGRKRPRYLRPGATVGLPGLPAGAVRVHVLGPPRDQQSLLRKDPKAGESYDPHLAAASAMASRFVSAAAQRPGETGRDEEHYPFNEPFKRRQPAGGPAAVRALARRYESPHEAWRSIDDAWLEQGEALALYLDSYTNNSSLVLAFELVESGKVLLFPGDAQAGNWRSWNTVEWKRPGVSTDDLLARTIFYKVGHHASHNATLLPVFEKMTHRDLSALIPVHKKDPNIARQHGWRMPARHLFARIQAKTDHRVLQMDDVNPPACRLTAAGAKAAWERAGITPRITGTSIRLDIKG